MGKNDKEEFVERVINGVAIVSAVLGCVMLMGAVGTVDYYVEMHESYPLYKLLVNVGVSILFFVPIFIRGVM